MAVTYLDKIVTSIKKGSTLLSNAFLYRDATKKPIKAIYMYRNGAKAYKYDKRVYQFGYTGDYWYGEIEADGGTITIGNPTSGMAHGDTPTVFSAVGWTITKGGVATTMSQTFAPSHGNATTYYYTLTQADSGLTAQARILQKADYVTARSLQITSFKYNSGSDISTAGATNIAVTELNVTLTNTWKSGTVTTDYYTLSNIGSSGLTVVYSGSAGSVQVDGTTGVINSISGLTTEKARTLIISPTVSVTYPNMATTSASYNVYQSANQVVSISASASPTSIGNTGGNVRVVAIGTLTSGSTIDISTSATWSCSGLTFTTISGCKYAVVPENTSSARTFSITCSYNSQYGYTSISQSAGSSWGYLLVTCPVTLSQNTYYLRREGGSTYALGSRYSSTQIKFTGANLESWNDWATSYWAQYGLFTSQSESGSMGVSVNLFQTDIDSIKAGTNVTKEAYTN